MGEQKLVERLRAAVNTSTVISWIKFIESTFPELEALAEQGVSMQSYSRPATPLLGGQEQQIKNYIYEEYGLTLRFARCTVRSFVDGVTISWEEE